MWQTPAQFPFAPWHQKRADRPAGQGDREKGQALNQEAGCEGDGATASAAGHAQGPKVKRWTEDALKDTDLRR